ncbi:hypothetical protein C8J57DRAFT_1504854 [Mycena rebaudengoi]|nr:hypothetical protein C8J57DRAFT_1504854 [Mycena rebaudengoi]
MRYYGTVAVFDLDQSTVLELNGTVTVNFTDPGDSAVTGGLILLRLVAIMFATTWMFLTTLIVTDATLVSRREEHPTYILLKSHLTYSGYIFVFPPRRQQEREERPAAAPLAAGLVEIELANLN